MTLNVRAILMTAAGLSATLAALEAQGADQRPVFRTAVARVAVAVVVQTRDGRPVTDLRPDEFTLVDSGKPRAISEVRQDESPVQLALLVDASGSMRLSDRRAAAKVVAGHVLAWLEPGVDHAGLYMFDSRVHELSPVQPARSGMLDEFDSLQPYGQTSLFDAVADTGRRIAAAGGSRRAVVALTDGVDTSSRLTAPEVSGIASGIDVPVYVVLIVPAPDQAGASREDLEHRLTMEREGQLGDLTRWTGGAIFAATSPARTSLAARQIVTELRQQYLVAFEPDERPGWHPIEVRTTRKDLVVRTRSGYLVGPRPTGV